MNLFEAINKEMNRFVKRRQNNKYQKLHFALKEHEFKDDPNYASFDIERCFADRKTEPDDGEIIKRIIAAYKKAKAAQEKAPVCYQVGNEWLPIFRRYLGEVMDALLREDIDTVRRIYRNFMRDPCSAGLVGLHIDMKKVFSGKSIKAKYRKVFMFDALHRFKHWHNMLGGSYTIESLASPDIGNPYGYYIGGVFVKAGADYQHYYAERIGRLAGRQECAVVAEIGGGYGGMAYYLIRDNPDMAYIDFDLPENMALTAYYLLTAFPGRKAVLFGEADISDSAVYQNDMIIMPNFEIEKLNDKAVDLVFNSYSLAEMSAEAVKCYITQVDRITKKYFFHVNHTRQSLVKADDFGIDPVRFNLIYKAPALWNAGRNYNMDEYEYLYERVI